ncbi:unnamed protein product, partial [Ectocarpus sp. 13 AM-2016]
AEKNINFSDHAREQLFDSDWSPSSLKLMESWYNKCMKASQSHIEAAIAARKRHVRVALPSIVVGSAATGIAFFSVGDECDETSAGRAEATAISVSLAVLTSALSVLGGFTALFALSERQQAHTTAAANFQNLARKIQLTLFIPAKLRNSCELKLSEASAEYNHIVESSPVVYGW